MKTILKNIAVLDARNATAERCAEIERMENVALILTSEASKPHLARIAQKNIASVVVIPNGANLTQINGRYTLTGDTERVFLMVNGEMDVDPSLSPEAISRAIMGGVVNGRVLCTASQAAALHAANLMVNGVISAYYDGCALRRGKEPYTESEARAQEKPPYFMKRVFFEPGAAKTLLDKGLRAFGGKGVLGRANDADALRAVWDGQGEIILIPEGYAVQHEDLDIRATNAFRLRGSVYLMGDLMLREDVPPSAIERLTGLFVRGTLTLPVSLCDAVMERLQNGPEIIAYEGAPVVNEEKLRLRAEGLSAMPEAITIFNDGMLSIDGDVEPDMLRARVRAIYNDGRLSLSPAQRGALTGRIFGDGTVTDGAEDAEKKSEAPDPNLLVIENAAQYVL